MDETNSELAWLSAGRAEIWQPISILIPRIVLLQSRFGVHRTIIGPGSYEVRTSATLKKRVYRRLR